MISVSFVVLKHQQRKDGTYPVLLRVIYRRKYAYMRTPYIVVKEQLDKNFEIKDKFIFAKVQNDKAKMYEIIASDFYEMSDLTVKGIAEYLFRKCYLKEKISQTLKFVPEANIIIEKIIARNKRSGSNYSIALRHLNRFFGTEEYCFEDLSIRKINEFDEYLQSLGVGPRGRVLYITNIGKIYKMTHTKYYDHGSGTSKIPPSSFELWSRPIIPKTDPRTLSLKMLRRLANVELTDRYEQLGRDVFMLSFYLAGMNTKDMYNIGDISNGRVTYNRSKTMSRRKDKALISIKIEPEAMEIIKRWPGKNTTLIFSELYASSDTFNANINDYIKRAAKAAKIEQNLTFYCARHTGASILVNKCENKNEEDAAFYLGHSSAHKEATTYVEKDFARLDRLNRMVIDYFLTANEDE